MMGFCDILMAEADIEGQHPFNNNQFLFQQQNNNYHAVEPRGVSSVQQQQQQQQPPPMTTTTEAATGDSLDSMLANALYRISFQEREKAMEDVHGISRSAKSLGSTNTSTSTNTGGVSNNNSNSDVSSSSSSSNSNAERGPQQQQQQQRHTLKKSLVATTAGIDDLDPNYVNSCLLELQTRLTSIMKNNSNRNVSTAYAEAAQRSEAYVQQRQLRTMFLQAEYFDIQRATDRLLRFFEVKKRLFGVDKLVKDITLDDLNENDMEILRAGGEGIVSSLLDSAGRPILVFMYKLRKYQIQNEVIQNIHRACFYVFMSLMESPAAQTKGIVCIYYVVNVNRPNSLKSVNTELRMSLPIHVKSYHLCTDHDGTYYAATGVAALSLHLRARTRTHLGSHVECLYKLVSFGIPRAALPVHDDGKCMVEGHLLWIEQRREIEAGRREYQERLTQQQQQQSGNHGQLELFRPLPTTSVGQFPARGYPSPFACATTTSNECSPPSPPSPASSNKNTTMMQKKKGDDTAMELLIPESNIRPNDVLLGRGKIVSDHPGNIKLRRLVDVYMSKYEESGKMEKTCLAEIIVQMIEESSGRFLDTTKHKSAAMSLTNNNNNNKAASPHHGMMVMWEEVDRDTARQKVAKTFRNRRSLRK